MYAYSNTCLQKYFGTCSKGIFLLQNSQEGFRLGFHPTAPSAGRSGGFLENRSSKTFKRNVLDHNIEAHKLCAYAIVVFTGVHFLAHLFNVLLLSDSYKSDQLLLAKLNTLFDGQTGRFQSFSEESESVAGDVNKTVE